MDLNPHAFVIFTVSCAINRSDLSVRRSLYVRTYPRSGSYEHRAANISLTYLCPKIASAAHYRGIFTRSVLIAVSACVACHSWLACCAGRLSRGPRPAPSALASGRQPDRAAAASSCRARSAIITPRAAAPASRQPRRRRLADRWPLKAQVVWQVSRCAC